MPRRRFCWRSDRVAVCIHLLPPALPPLPAHGLPPALCKPGCRHAHAHASSGRPAAHWQRHHPSPGRLDWRASMTSSHHWDYPQRPHQAAKPTPHSQWLTDSCIHSSGQWNASCISILLNPTLRVAPTLFLFWFFSLWFCSAAIKVYI